MFGFRIRTTVFLLVAYLSLARTAAAADIAPVLERGRAAFAAGKIDDALKAFGEAVAQDAKSAQARYFLGVALEAKKKGAEAEKAYRQAIALDARLAQAHLNLGSLLVASGKLAEAEKSYRTAISVNPKYAGAFFNLGVLYDRQNKDAEAVAAYRSAARFEPKDVSARLNLGAALRRSGDLDGAIVEARAALGLDPKNKLALLNLGLLLSDKGDFAGAKSSLQKVVDLYPGDAGGWQALGRVALRRKAPAEALEALRKASKLDSRDPGIAEDRCRAEAAVDSAGNEAISACRAAIALDGTRPMPRYMLAKLQAARGECAAAKKEMAQFLALPGLTDRAKEGASALLAACGKK